MNDMGGLLAGGALSVSGACGVGKHKDRFLRFGPLVTVALCRLTQGVAHALGQHVGC